MGDRFDKLAKDAAADLPRRQAFRLIGGGLIAVVLASLGLAADNTKSACVQICLDCCGTNFSHPRDGGVGKEYALCIRNCHAGVATNGVCGSLPGC
ncbi:MAG: hypothetical protein A3H96_21010 [Acidobacteria bacterium RIFCSPLOWO2_02_FULL_67_36]|nr:MAG: hypothetical protein A3H96_21010 [Acidobacteria bacterium RIFCSPLOWO2_02_FULL_67_36]OFW21913.1 MAG: hypothetical protein A3G21_08575 [Acidobacteria bacterium RIFCSPLOWO2_12_FULL_66_21]